VLRIIRADRGGARLWHGRKGSGTIAVYDLGGGTAPTSRCSRWRRRVESIDQRRHVLGGEDFDKKIIDYLADEFKGAGHRPAQRQLALQRPKERRKAKVELSASVQTESTLPFITADQNGPKHSTSS
jgi:molecular chaperone DnaK